MTYNVYFKKNKFGAKKKSFQGHSYDSGLEAQCATELDILLKAKEIKNVDRQVKLDLTAHGKHICFYYIDFVVTHNDDSLEYLEVKGMALPVWRIKWKLLEAQLEEEDPMAVMTVYKESQFDYRTKLKSVR
jgi:hypothetical protein